MTKQTITVFGCLLISLILCIVFWAAHREFVPDIPKDTVWILTDADSTIIAVYEWPPEVLDTTQFKYKKYLYQDLFSQYDDCRQENYYMGEKLTLYLGHKDGWMVINSVLHKSLFDEGIMWQYKGRLPEQDLEGLKLFTMREK